MNVVALALMLMMSWWQEPIWAVCTVPERTILPTDIVTFSPSTDATERALIYELIAQSSYDFDPLIEALGRPIHVTVEGVENYVTVDRNYEWAEGIVIHISSPKSLMHEVGHIHDVVLKKDQGDWEAWRALNLPYLERPQEIYAIKFSIYHSPSDSCG